MNQKELIKLQRFNREIIYVYKTESSLLGLNYDAVGETDNDIMNRINIWLAHNTCRVINIDCLKINKQYRAFNVFVAYIKDHEPIWVLPLLLNEFFDASKRLSDHVVASGKYIDIYEMLDIAHGYIRVTLLRSDDFKTSNDSIEIPMNEVCHRANIFFRINYDTVKSYLI